MDGFRCSTIALAAVAWLLAPGPGRAQGGPTARLTTTDDAAAGEIVLTLGPLQLPARSSHHDIAQVPMQVSRVPVDGWLHGYRLTLATADGRPIPQVVLHHVNLIDLERRALLAPIANRLLAMGQETVAASLPRTVGYPVKTGQQLGVFTGFHNPTDTAYRDAYLTLALKVTRAPASPAPRDIYSVWFDVKLEPGQPTSYDLPPGPSARWQEFTAPIGGELLALGGHLHDYGVRLTLEDRTTGEVLYDVEPVTDSTGHVRRVPLRLHLQEPLRLVSGHTYRITAYYRNPTGATISDGGMGTIGGVFIPAAGERWPTLDRTDPLYLADLHGLEAGHGGASHSHGAHSRPER